MWLTDEDKTLSDATLHGASPVRHCSVGYIKGDYCPYCGVQQLRIDFMHNYICNGANRSQGRPLIRQLVCDHCRRGFDDTIEERWRLRTNQRGDYSGVSIDTELLNPHNWRKNREKVREYIRSINGKKCRKTILTPKGMYDGRCGFPFGHEGTHREFTLQSRLK